jgi:hypothetical protein
MASPRAGATGAPAGSRLVRLYPAAWRARYGEEMRAVLEARPPGLRERLDLVRGALDAHLHPDRPSWLPAYVSLAGGALWTSGALVVLAQPAPPDWPGYVVDMLPNALAGAALLLLAIMGVWLRLGDAASPFARVALQVAVAGHLAWLVAIGAALLAVDYGSTTAIAGTAAAIGTFLVGVALTRAGDWPIAGLLTLAPVALLLPWGAPAWLVFGLAWTAIGFAQLRGRAEAPASPA